VSNEPMGEAMNNPSARRGDRPDAAPCRHLVRPAVLAIKPYVPGKSILEVQREYALTDVVKLASNENPAGPSPMALAAIQAELAGLHLYPETGAELRGALAERCGVPLDTVLLGHGATDLLDLVARTFICPGDEVISAHPSFVWFQMIADLSGARNVVVPLRDHTHDLDAMAARITDRTKLLFLANPNNPTGTTVPPDALDAFVARLPDGVVLVLDEAYIDYVADGAPRCIDYLWRKAVIVVRTFSKIAGLAGLRIGYALARPEIAELVAKVQPPFNTTNLAHAAALASLTDEQHRADSRETARLGRELLYAGLSRLDVRFVPSQANFVFVDFQSSVSPIAEALLRRGFAVRPMLDTCARITVGSPAQCSAFVHALEQVLSGPTGKGDAADHHPASG
jgi:histidinol-phosphate aminotransferase